MPYANPQKRKEYFREWQRKNGERTKKYRAKYYANNREAIITQATFTTLKARRLARLDCLLHYSNGKNCCECCGENNLEFLALDHTNGGGGKHRKTLKEYLPLVLKRKNYPVGYRVLCHNCNCSLGYYGYCPHKKKNHTT